MPEKSEKATREEVDDILEMLKSGKGAKKRKNSNRKGKRAERNLCAILSQRFNKPFAKNPDNFGSGAWSTTHSDQQEGLDLDHMCGDILTPKGFLFAIESKSGYGIEILNLFPGARRKKDRKLIEDFLNQVERDAGRVSKKPLLLYKKDYCPHIAFVRPVDFPEISQINVKLTYGAYVIVSLEDLLSLPDPLFFEPGPVPLT